MWNENMCNYKEIMRPGFERMTSVTSMISLKFCTKCFENVHLAYENSPKPIKKKTVRDDLKINFRMVSAQHFIMRPQVFTNVLKVFAQKCYSYISHGACF